MLFLKKTYTHCNDEELMKFIAAKNQKAFEVLYDRYSVRIYRFFYRMLWQNSAIAEDFTQDVFLKIIEKASTFDTKLSFKSWIFSIASNLCKNAYRDKKQVESIDNQVFEIDDNALKLMDVEKYEAHLYQVILELEPIHKEVFVLRFIEELSIKEIAEIQNIPEGTVKSRLHFATKKIAKQLAWYKEIFT